MQNNVVSIENARNAAYDKATFDLDEYEAIAVLADDCSKNVLRIAHIESKLRDMNDSAALRYLDSIAQRSTRRFMNRVYNELSA